MELTGEQFIGFQRTEKGSGTFEAMNPETMEVLEGSFFEASTVEIREAVQLAKKAFKTYKNSTNENRASFLETIGDELLEMGDELILRCKAETALPEARLNGERMRTVNQMKLFARVVREGSWIDARIDTADPNREPLPKPDIRQMQIPLGPVGIFGASNFPLAFSVAGGDTASALAAGCPVVVKAHPLHPGTSEMVAQAIINAAKKTGMPEGVFSMVQGHSNRVGMDIVNHPDIAAIGFTGSYYGGKAIFDAAHQRPKPIPVFAEMGSSNPVFLLPGALKSDDGKLAEGLVNALNLGVGQFCTNPGLVVSEDDEHTKAFMHRMTELIKKSSTGTMLSSGIKSNFEKGLDRLKKTTNLSAVADEPVEGNKVKSHLFQVQAQELIKNPELQDEVFGPSTLFVQADSKAELLALAENMQGHLTATIHGTEQELKEHTELIQILQEKAGRVIFNGFPTGVEVGYAMVHGGPFPATTAPQTTSVGTAAIRRFSRPVCFQDFTQDALPEALRDGNPLNIWRMINGDMQKG